MDLATPTTTGKMRLSLALLGILQWCTKLRSHVYYLISYCESNNPGKGELGREGENLTRTDKLNITYRFICSLHSSSCCCCWDCCSCCRCGRCGGSSRGCSGRLTLCCLHTWCSHWNFRRSVEAKTWVIPTYSMECTVDHGGSVSVGPDSDKGFTINCKKMLTIHLAVGYCNLSLNNISWGSN